MDLFYDKMCSSMAADQATVVDGCRVILAWAISCAYCTFCKICVTKVWWISCIHLSLLCDWGRNSIPAHQLIALEFNLNGQCIATSNNCPDFTHFRALEKASPDSACSRGTMTTTLQDSLVCNLKISRTSDKRTSEYSKVLTFRPTSILWLSTFSAAVLGFVDLVKSVIKFDAKVVSELQSKKVKLVPCLISLPLVTQVQPLRYSCLQPSAILRAPPAVIKALITPVSLVSRDEKKILNWA